MSDSEIYKIVIDDEFRSLIPPLTKEEYDGLEESILDRGCIDALLVWDKVDFINYGDFPEPVDLRTYILVDGHNRYEICKKHGIEYQVRLMDFDDRDEAMLWMMKNQLARRNLNDFQRIEITHKCEDAVRKKAKERQAEYYGNQHEGGLVEIFPEVQKGDNVKDVKGTSRDELGAMAGVSGKTYEHAVTVIESAPKPVVDATRKNDLSINAAYQVTRMEPEQQQEVADRIKKGEKAKDVVSDVQKRPHVSYNTGNNEWYTPEDYIAAAREVMGNIDLDPASSDIANKTVKADIYYTAETNGLDKPWSGNVWMNPPYAAELIKKFADKFVEELDNIKDCIILVNNATESMWFLKFITHANAVCFPRGRVRFLDPEGNPGAPLQGQAVIYRGKHIEKFIELFSEKGWCARL